jgi:hypothetical protein
MTRYAIDEARGELLAMWETGYGAVAMRVAPLPNGLPDGERRALAAELSGLSEALWRCYTHPASAADSLDVNTEGWRREQSREAFGSVVDHIRRPNLPGHGSLMVSYDAVQERAHRVGRCLHRATDTDLSTAVIRDVEAELAAVERAELGDLSGRSVQAVQLTRQDASPVQVAVADRILADNPLGGDDLFLELDPTSACVAAAHWLQAAADVVEELSGIAATNVVLEADNIEALPHATPTAVLELMDLGTSPTTAVTGLIRDAMAVAEGEVPDLDELQDKIEEAEEDIEQYAQGNPAAAAELRKIRLTTLDPGRPARDMLEDLLYGIRGCWLLYQEYAETPGGPTDEDGPDDDEDGADDEDDEDGGMSDDELDDAINAAFCDAVRARATADRYRLDLEPRPTAAADVEATDDDDMDEVDVNLEAADTCEHLVQLVLDSESWDIPRDVMNSVLEFNREESGRLAALLISRAAGYLVSFKDAGLPREQLDAAVNWVGDEQGAEYAGPAAMVAALAGHPGSQALLAQQLGVEDVTLDQLVDFLGADFFPAMIWLCCGMVATVGFGDVEWLRQHRIAGS